MNEAIAVAVGALIGSVAQILLHTAQWHTRRADRNDEARRTATLSFERARGKELDDLRGRVNQLQSENDNLRDQINQLKDSLAEARREIDDLKALIRRHP